MSSATFKECRFASSAAFVVALPPLRVLWRRRNDVFKNKSPEEACKEYRSSVSKEIPEEEISQKKRYEKRISSSTSTAEASYVAETTSTRIQKCPS